MTIGALWRPHDSHNHEIHSIVHMADVASSASVDASEGSDDPCDDSSDDTFAKRVAGQRDNHSQSSDRDEAGVSYEDPTLIHRFYHDQSILCLAVTKSCIFAGSQSGQILVRLLLEKKAPSLRDVVA